MCRPGAGRRPVAAVSSAVTLRWDTRHPWGPRGSRGVDDICRHVRRDLPGDAAVSSPGTAARPRRRPAPPAGLRRILVGDTRSTAASRAMCRTRHAGRTGPVARRRSPPSHREDGDHLARAAPDVQPIRLPASADSADDGASARTARPARVGEIPPAVRHRRPSGLRAACRWKSGAGTGSSAAVTTGCSVAHVRPQLGDRRQAPGLGRARHWLHPTGCRGIGPDRSTGPRRCDHLRSRRSSSSSNMP